MFPPQPFPLSLLPLAPISSLPFFLSQNSNFKKFFIYLLFVRQGLRDSVKQARELAQCVKALATKPEFDPWDKREPAAVHVHAYTHKHTKKMVNQGGSKECL